MHDVAVDLSGKYVYTLELGNNHRIQKFSADGQFITKRSFEGFEGAKSYRDPHQIAIDSLGNVFLPDKDDSKVLKFDSSSNYIIKWGTDGTGDSQFNTARSSH